jgi:F-type H+-transporting ATPase subunit b
MPDVFSLTTVIAASEEASGGNGLVSPNTGVMIWTLIAFGITVFVLKKYAFPPINAALDKRQRSIEEAIDHADQTRAEADRLLAEYRERLKEARLQADDIVAKAKKIGDAEQADSLARARAEREVQIEGARREIEQATAKAKQDLRNEVADLTVLATEKITRRSLTGDDQQRLVDEALGELDFSSLGGSNN